MSKECNHMIGIVDDFEGKGFVLIYSSDTEMDLDYKFEYCPKCGKKI